MKKNRFILIILLLSTLAEAQNTFKLSGGQLRANKGVNIVLQNTDWITNTSTSLDSSTVILRGDSLTTIGGSMETTFFNVLLDKNLGQAILSQNTTVNRNISLNTGKLDLNGQDLSLGSAKGQILNESENSRIIGPIGGEIVKTIDLNAPAAENPGNIGILITSNQNLGSTEIRRGHTPSNIPSHISIERYYTVNPVNNSGLNASLQMTYFDAELNGILESGLIPFQLDNSNWINLTASASDPNINYVEIEGINTFSRWTLAAEAGGFLPIELVYFDAEALENRTSLLTWQTATEINNDYFTIERSQNGIDFEVIKEMDGAGNSNTLISYETIDTKPFNGINYYRLKQTDFDGSYSYSSIRSVYFGEDESLPLISIFPNPASEQIYIQIKNAEKGNIELFDALGRKIFQIPIKENYSIDISKLARGAYFLHINSDGIQHIEKLIFN